MARNDDTTPTGHDGTDTDERAGRPVRSRFSEWIATRPAAGAALLALGSSVLAWQAVSLLASVPGGTVTLAGVAGVAAPVFAVVVALFALGRPDYSTVAGLVGGSIVLLDVVGMMYAPTPIEYPQLVVSALLVAGIGGVLCVGWRAGGPTVEFGRIDDVFSHGRSLLVVGLVVLLALNGAPAVTAQEKVPQQQGALGGLVLDQGTLAAGFYSYQASCPKPKDPLITLGEDEPCLDATVDSSERASGSIDRVARQQLDSALGKKVLIDDFLIFKNFYNPDQDKFEHVELSATQAIAETDDGEDPRAVSVYISEYRAENNEARLNLVDIPLIEDPGIKVDNVNYWTCTPQNESGQGSINDIRFGIDSDPTLTGGKDATLLAHQLGSTQTTLTNFKLKVRPGKRDRPVADADPTDPPSNCLEGTITD
ncbi:hypothetical protein [Halorientalis salina]|uniref:hypothetical protein n=1 Tax=Halorientalis salina TaxID=2932266 RepID=UPI0010AB9D39|nr:hypothetical protein [Halorientalis salina]